MKISRKILAFLMTVAVLSTVITPISVNASAGKTFKEVSGIVQKYRVTGTSAWENLTPSSAFSGADGILLQTENKPYYLKYKCRDNYRGWLDPVLSTDSGPYDYAGWPGYSVTNISIEVYDHNGRVNDDYVVMYRAKVAGSWLNWISNGTADVMRTIKDEFGLDGDIDAVLNDSGAANLGYIQALEIRMYERIGNYPTPSANAKIIDAPYIYQNFDYPNGCESVSAVMALQYLGIKIDTDTFIDKYLDMGETPTVGDKGPDPNEVYCGDPRLKTGWGCYSPVIEKALNKFVDSDKYRVSRFLGKSLDELCATFIDNDIPVMIWATVGMVDSSAGSYYASWKTDGGKTVTYNKKLHCLLLVGYDEDNYYFNDPMHMNTDGTKYTGYSKADVEKAYDILHQQSIVIAPKLKPFSEIMKKSAVMTAHRTIKSFPVTFKSSEER